MRVFYAGAAGFVYEAFPIGLYRRLETLAAGAWHGARRAAGASRRFSILMLASFALLPAACGGGDLESSVLDSEAELPPEVAAAHTEDAALGGHAPDSSSDDEAEHSDPAPDSADVDDSKAASEDNGLESSSYNDAMDICDELQEPMARTLGLTAAGLTAKPADVRNENWGVTLDGCQLYVESLGRDLLIGANHEDLPAFRMRRLLRNFGWAENIEYQKSEAGETTAGFERLNALCLVNVAFSPPKGMACPESDPITCGRSPLDLEYQIALRCALP